MIVCDTTYYTTSGDLLAPVENLTVIHAGPTSITLGWNVRDSNKLMHYMHDVM